MSASLTLCCILTLVILQILSYILSILQDASILISLQLSNAPMEGAVLVSSETKHYKVSKKGVKKDKEAKSAARMAKKKSSTFHAAMEALSMLLRHCPNTTNSAPNTTNSNYFEGAAYFLEKRCLYETGVLQSASALPVLAGRLVQLFNDIVNVDESLQPQYVLEALRKIVGVLQYCPVDGEVEGLLRHFPFACREITKYPSDSTSYAVCLEATEFLNVDISELAISSLRGQGNDSISRYLEQLQDTSIAALTLSTAPNSFEGEEEEAVDHHTRTKAFYTTILARIFSFSSMLGRSAFLLDSYLRQMQAVFEHLRNHVEETGDETTLNTLRNSHSSPRTALLEAAVKSLCSLSSSQGSTANEDTLQRFVDIWCILAVLLAQEETCDYVSLMAVRSVRQLLFVLAAEGTAAMIGALSSQLLIFFGILKSSSGYELSNLSAFSSLSAELQIVLLDLLALFPLDVLLNALPALNTVMLHNQSQSMVSVAGYFHRILSFRSLELGQEVMFSLLQDSLDLVLTSFGVYSTAFAGLLADWMVNIIDGRPEDIGAATTCTALHVRSKMSEGLDHKTMLAYAHVVLILDAALLANFSDGLIMSDCSVIFERISSCAVHVLQHAANLVESDLDSAIVVCLLHLNNALQAAHGANNADLFFPLLARLLNSSSQAIVDSNSADETLVYLRAVSMLLRTVRGYFSDGKGDDQAWFESVVKAWQEHLKGSVEHAQRLSGSDRTAVRTACDDLWDFLLL